MAPSWRILLLWRKGAQRQGVHWRIHQFCKRIVNHPVPGDAVFALERGRGDVQPEMCFARWLCPAMPRMAVGFINDLKNRRCKALFKSCPYHAGDIHLGSVRLEKSVT